MLSKLSGYIYKLFRNVFNVEFNKEGFLLYFRNIQLLSISKIFTLFFSLITTIVTARILGPETFGTLNYAISITTIFAIIASLGIDSIVLKELGLEKEKSSEILGSSLFLKFSS